MIKVDITSDTRYQVNRKSIRSAVVDTLTKNKVTVGDIEVSVAVVGRRKMRNLVSKYLGDGTDHEILSFPYEDIGAVGTQGFINPPDDILRLGDIVLSWPDVVLCAGQDGVMVDQEIYMLTAHGVEHLLGNHHE